MLTGYKSGGVIKAQKGLGKTISKALSTVKKYATMPSQEEVRRAGLVALEDMYKSGEPLISITDNLHLKTNNSSGIESIPFRSYRGYTTRGVLYPSELTIGNPDGFTNTFGRSADYFETSEKMRIAAESKRAKDNYLLTKRRFERASKEGMPDWWLKSYYNDLTKAFDDYNYWLSKSINTTDDYGQDGIKIIGNGSIKSIF